MNMKVTLYLGPALAVLLSLLKCSPAAQAAPGELDPSFAGTGKVVLRFGGGDAAAYAAAAQSDGKLLLAGYGNGTSDFYQGTGGDFLIARFTTNNTLDASFGDGGKVLTRVTPVYPTLQLKSSAINALAVQADGKIVAGGFSYQNTNYTSFTLVRYNPDGSLDTGFGTNGTGIVYTDLGQSSGLSALALQADGRIVVAGSAASGIALARYQTNGVLDATFGSGGTVVMHSGGALNGLLIEGSGSIVALGSTAGHQFAVYQFTTNGVLDTSFGTGGEVTTPIPGGAAVAAIQLGSLVVQNPDKLVVAGGSFIVRYSLNGTLDTLFGGTGIVTNGFGSITGLAVQGVLNQPRKITVTGGGLNGNNYYFNLARYTAGGSLDTAFGTNGTGTVVLPMANWSTDHRYADPRAMTFQSGDFVLAGDYGIESGISEFAAVRFTSGGVLDTTFGSNGVLLADVSDAAAQARAVAVQPDGKLVVAGQAGYFTNSDEYYAFALARLNPDGSLDGAFGVNGKVTTPLGSGVVVNAVALQPDGKILAAGSSDSAFEVARYNADGSPDSSFGNNGVASVLIGTGGGGPAQALGIQSDGKIVVAGYAGDANYEDQFAVARFNPNGALDTSFGSAGKILTTIGTESWALGAGIQPDGKIVAAGVTGSQNGSTINLDFVAARYNSNGALDLSFGSLGRATLNAGSGTWDGAYALAIQPDGKILLAGAAAFGGFPGPLSGNQVVNSFVALARFNTNGAPDTTFGNNGTVLTEVGGYSDYALSVALQPDGKILVAGASQSANYKWFAQRYNADGVLDSSYGNGGAALLDFSSGTNEFAYGLALDASGRAVLAGDAGGGFGVARLQGDFVPRPLLRIVLTTTNTAVISWPYPSAGWSLQQNSDLRTASWTIPPETVSNDGTNNFIVVSPPAGNLFFRLKQ